MPLSDDDKMKLAIDAWKQSIEVQQHFNEICMKIRNFYISFVSALLALIGVVVSGIDDPFFVLWEYDVHIALPILFAAIIATYLFYFVDLHWYHRLLKGAVRNALEIEKRYKSEVVGLQLTTLIGRESPIDVSSNWPIGNWLFWIFGILFGADDRVRKKNEVHSDAKIGIFYKSISWIFIVLFLAFAFFGGIKALPIKALP